MKHELCKLAEIPAAGTLIVSFFGRELHVYRSGDRIRAAANVCLHFGGPLECRGDRLVCPWHEAAFDMATGDRVEGPAPKGSRLLFLSTLVEDNALYYVWGERDHDRSTLMNAGILIGEFGRTPSRWRPSIAGAKPTVAHRAGPLSAFPNRT